MKSLSYKTNYNCYMQLIFPVEIFKFFWLYFKKQSELLSISLVDEGR